MNGMDFNNYVENIQFKYTVFQALQCEFSSVVSRGVEHMHDGIKQMALMIPHNFCHHAACQVPCAGKCQGYRGTEKGRT